MSAVCEDEADELMYRKNNNVTLSGSRTLSVDIANVLGDWARSTTLPEIATETVLMSCRSIAWYWHHRRECFQLESPHPDDRDKRKVQYWTTFPS